MQFSFSGPGKVRKINLAGSSSSQSSEALLREARAKREARETEQRRQNSATRLAVWWRSVQATHAVREQYAESFDAGPGQSSPIEWTRYLLIAGTKGELGEARLGRWSAEFVTDNNGGVSYLNCMAG
jgi:hypothetical protein